MHLPGILSEYGNEIEADFQQYYNIDIADMFRGEISPAKVLRLINSLPADSRFVRAAAGPRANWTTAEYLLAAMLDTLQSGNWQRGGGKGARPKPVPRPGDQDRVNKRTGTTSRGQSEIKQYLSDLKAGKVKSNNKGLTTYGYKP